MLEDRAGGGVDLVVIFHIAGFELDLVDEYSIFIVQFDIHVIRFIFTHTCVIQGNRFCLGVANVLRCSGRIGLLIRGLRCLIWREGVEAVVSKSFCPLITFPV